MQVGWEGGEGGAKGENIIETLVWRWEGGHEENSKLGEINNRSQVRIVSFQTDASCCKLDQQAEAG